MNTLFIIGRVLFGGYFLFSGIMHFKNHKMMTGYAQSKGVIMPSFAVILTGIILSLGGLGIVVGSYLEISYALIAIFLFFVTPKMHTFWKETDPNKKMAEMQGFLKNMAMFGASLVLMVLSLGM